MSNSNSEKSVTKTPRVTIAQLNAKIDNLIKAHNDISEKFHREYTAHLDTKKKYQDQTRKLVAAVSTNQRLCQNLTEVLPHLVQ